MSEEKLTVIEKDSIENIKNGIKIARASCYDAYGNFNKKENTCAITKEMIGNISFFLSHKLPKCKYLNMSLENIKNGRIISRGSYGYSFLVSDRNNKKKIIKIILAKDDDVYDYDDESDSTDSTDSTDSYVEKLKKEIDMHKLISNTPNDNFIKLYGYFVKEEHKSILGTKLSYNYYDVKDNRKCNLRSTQFDNYRELYLVMEAGITDLLNIKMSEYLMELDEITDLFIKLFDFYKISQYFIDTQNKWFIHSDIKPANIVLVDEEKKFKLIDFGLSVLSDNFYDVTAIGTMYMYHYLYYSPITQHRELYRRSPMSDIFSIVLSFIEIFLYKFIKFDILEVIGFDRLEKKVNEEIQHMKISDLTRNNIMRILTIGRVINDFYAKNINEFESKIYKVRPESRTYYNVVDEIKDKLEIKNLVITQPRFYVDIPPKFEDNIKKTKLQNDYDYLDKIMTYLTKSKTYYDLYQEESVA